MAPLGIEMKRLFHMSLIQLIFYRVVFNIAVLTIIAYGLPRSSRGILCPHSPFHDSRA